MTGLVPHFCRCGNPIHDEDDLCNRCRYYHNVFSPPPPIFESKREVALKAISLRKITRGRDKFVVVE